MAEQDVSHHRVTRGAGDRHGRSTYNRSVADNSPSLFRSPAFIVLVVGTVVALACGLGPAWLVRVGVGVALLTAFCSLALTWREMDRMVARHAAELGEARALTRTAREQGRAAARSHHAESMAMINRFTTRQAAHRAHIAAARAEADQLRTSLASTRLDVEAKQTRIASLNHTVRQLENELAAIQGVDEVLNLPRRGTARHARPQHGGIVGQRSQQVREA